MDQLKVIVEKISIIERNIFYNNIDTEKDNPFILLQFLCNFVKDLSKTKKCQHILLCLQMSKRNIHKNICC